MQKLQEALELSKQFPLKGTAILQPIFMGEVLEAPS